MARQIVPLDAAGKRADAAQNAAKGVASKRSKSRRGTEPAKHPPLKLACADFAFPLLDHDRALDLVAMLEFDGIDIGLFEKRSHLWPSIEFADPAAAKRLSRKLAERGIKAADVFLQMDPDFIPYAINHPQPARRKKAREWFQRSLDYAAAAGCRHLTTLPGVAFDGESRSESLERAVDELLWRVDAAKRCGVTFAVEAHVGSIASTPKQAVSLLDQAPGLTLTLDYTHFVRMGRSESEIEKLTRYASHFHARGARRGRLQSSFHHSSIDYERVVRQLRKYSYSGFIGVEYVWTEWERCNEVDNLSETILFRNFFRSL